MKYRVLKTKRFRVLVVPPSERYAWIVCQTQYPVVVGEAEKLEEAERQGESMLEILTQAAEALDLLNATQT